MSSLLQRGRRELGPGARHVSTPPALLSMQEPLGGPRCLLPVLAGPRCLLPVLAGPRCLLPVLAGPRCLLPVLAGPRCLLPGLAGPRCLLLLLSSLCCGPHVLLSAAAALPQCTVLDWQPRWPPT